LNRWNSTVYQIDIYKYECLLFFSCLFFKFINIKMMNIMLFEPIYRFLPSCSCKSIRLCFSQSRSCRKRRLRKARKWSAPGKKQLQLQPTYININVPVVMIMVVGSWKSLHLVYRDRNAHEKYHKKDWVKPVIVAK